jgi:DNA-directed RNA polymerase specialized sigma24 family protein
VNNDEDIRLLNEDPGKLLIRYQSTIRIIVKSLAFKGYLPRRDISDLIQDVNRKLVERMPRIRRQYNGRCRFSTYFSVVVRNLCMEEFRKLKILAEPQPEAYERVSPESAADPLVIRQEYERFCRALRLFYREEPALWLTFKVMADLDIVETDLDRFGKQLSPDRADWVISQCGEAIHKSKKEKFVILSDVLTAFEEKEKSPDALRKWFSSRLGEILSLMNGNPPRSAFTLEILIILIEKSENDKKDP